jgi:magnesium-protoporphyrin O-methyltransferase
LAGDISEKMITEAQEKATATLTNRDNVRFVVQDLEELTGEYDTVICLDVLIHYPTEEAADMINHLASLAKSRLIISFAPKTLCLTILKKIGEFFPGPSKTTRAYQHKEKEIIQILEDRGFEIKRNGMTSTRFYYSRILEAVRK